MWTVLWRQRASFRTFGRWRPALQRVYCPPGFADCQDMFRAVRNGTWWLRLAGAAVWFAGAKARKCTNVTNSVRKAFIKYFKNEGQVYIGSGTCKGHKAITFCTRSQYFKINNTCCYTLWKTQQSSSGLPTWCFGSESLHSRYPVRWPLFVFHSLEFSEIG